MNTLTAAELKRRGMAAIEENLRRGPIHLLKRNRPAAVVISPDQYLELTRGKTGVAGGVTAIQWLLSQPVIGKKRKARIDRDLRVERDSWA